ncbi:MAG: porin, partial [Pseudomonadota bacterium]
MHTKTTPLLIAGSMLLAAAPSHAGITIGGSVNAEVASVSGDGYQGDEGIMVTDAMRRDGPYGGNNTWFGAKGSYDAGNGYKAIARLRFKLQPGKWGDNSTKSFNNSETSSKDGGDGDSLFSGRDAFAGIKTPYGDVTVGTMSSPYKSTTVKWDPMLGTFMQARGQGGMSKAHNSYMPNTVAYGNTFGSVWVKAAVILDQSDSDDDGEFDAENGMSLGMRVSLSDSTTLA